MNNALDGDKRLLVFAYINTEKTPQYRAIMRVFVDAKARFALHLRPQEIVAALAESDWAAPMDLADVETALAQLCDWRNLESHPDTADVATVEEFYRPRYLFQLTSEGEAAERAIAFFEEMLPKRGELQTAALGDIGSLLQEVLQFAASDTPEDAKVHLTLKSLQARFDELTSQAQIFIGSLQRTIDLQGIDVPAFLAYKETLIKYLERFISELVIATIEITATLESIGEAGMARLLGLAARRDLADALAPTEADYQRSLRLWRARWDGLRAWFLQQPDLPSQAEILRARARSSIPALLAAVAAIHDRRVARSDRVSDLRTLARWFAEVDTDREAHRLWRAAFALAPARHLRVDDRTLDEREASPVLPQTSWLEAPPLRISPRLRRTGRYVRPGGSGRVVDYRQQKAELARLAAAEAEQVAAAQHRLATGSPIRLSEIGELDPTEFHLFLDILGEALTHKIDPMAAVDATSNDGALRIRLAPTSDNVTAIIETGTGRFSGDDHWVTITNAFDSDGELMGGRA
jgi:uncharacterized protein (TIGR02677 family)